MGNVQQKYPHRARLDKLHSSEQIGGGALIFENQSSPSRETQQAPARRKSSSQKENEDGAMNGMKVEKGHQRHQDGSKKPSKGSLKLEHDEGKDELLDYHAASTSKHANYSPIGL